MPQACVSDGCACVSTNDEGKNEAKEGKRSPKITWTQESGLAGEETRCPCAPCVPGTHDS
jgi:hypothetical protein